MTHNEKIFCRIGTVLVENLHHLRTESRRTHELHLILVSKIRKKGGPCIRFDGRPVERVGRTLYALKDAAVDVVFSGAFRIWKWLSVDTCVG